MQKQQRIIITIVACSFFMEGLDGTIINTALPQMAHSLGIYPLHLKLALTAYLLMAGFIIPISGWLSDRFGTKIILASALMLFLGGSISCGLATSLPALIISRIVQGAGGALSLPVGRLLLLRTFSKEEYIHAMMLTATFGLMGPAFGPLAGGILTTYTSWRMIFFVNIPLGFFGFYYVMKYIQNFKDPKIHSFDWIGFAIIGLTLSLLLIGFEPILSNELRLNAFMLGLFSLLCYYFYAKQKTNPVIDLDLFKNRTFSFVILGSSFVRLSINSSPFLIPLLLQLEFDYTAMQSGFVTAWMALGMLTTKLCFPHFLKRYSLLEILKKNTIGLTIMGVLLTLLTFQPNFFIIGTILFLNGFIMSLQFSAMNSLTYTSIHQDLQMAGTGFVNSFQQIMSSFSIAIAGLLLQTFAHSDNILQKQSLLAFRITFMIMALFPLIGFFIFRRLRDEEEKQIPKIPTSDAG